MKNRPSYFRQTNILTSRYLRVFFNDRQNLSLAIMLPLLTIVIVAAVASGDMFSLSTQADHTVNGGLPILSWQQSVQETDGEFVVHDYGIDEVDDKVCAYVIFEDNNYKELVEPNIKVVEMNNEDEVLVDTSGERVNGKDKGIYSLRCEIGNGSKLKEGSEYKLTLSAKKVKDADDKNLGKFENEYTIVAKGEDNYDDVTDDVKTAKSDLTEYKKLKKDFDLGEYYSNQDNARKLMSLPDATMRIGGKDYVVISDAETLVYILSDKEDLKKYGDDGDNEKWCGYNYYLNENIDLNEYSDDLMPLGTEKAFSGTFEGNGHIIKNFKFAGNSQAGLFATVSGEVMNLGVENANVKTTAECAGVIAAKLEGNAKVHSCYVKDSDVEAEDGFVGAIAGKFVNADKDGIVHTCYANEVNVKTDKEYAGGIVGDLGEGKLKACYFVGKIDTDSKNDHIGTITGNVVNRDANVENCFYISRSDESVKAVGDGQESVDIKKNNVISVKQDKLEEYSAMLGYNYGDKDDEETDYGFKKDGQLAMFDETQIGLFMLMCVAIFVGICNSIQEICKERNILKREYMTNLRLTSYVSSKLIVQAMVCAVQMLLVLGVFGIAVGGKDMYTTGVLLPWVWMEYFVTMFLLCFSADILALVVSAVVKSSSVASTFIPVILIVQVIFTGVLFDVGKAMDAVAGLMISKWGMAGLAISSRLNDARLTMLINTPDLELQMGSKMAAVKDAYLATPANLLKVWGVLVACIVLYSVLCTVFLIRVKKDKR
ncbi:MAG: ABC transporter permease [Eubacterium sp.]|nr:ABC transporter permease [Eubacterium sp.]